MPKWFEKINFPEVQFSGNVRDRRLVGVFVRVGFGSSRGLVLAGVAQW
jgi:hypothetical protein